jgi:hypothetical protein
MWLTRNNPLGSLGLLCLVLFVFSCTEQPNTKVRSTGAVDPMAAHYQLLNGVIFRDVFSPPVASRIFMYTSLAAYEAARLSDTTGQFPSLAVQVNGFSAAPSIKTQGLIPEVAVLYAFTHVAEALTFSKDSVQAYRMGWENHWKQEMSKQEIAASKIAGNQIGQWILQRAANDHYKASRAMPKYLGSDAPGGWKPTPTDYLDGLEPYWRTILPLVWDSNSVCQPKPAPRFDSTKGSTFYDLADELVAMRRNLSDSQMQTATYWDDNPFVIEHKGHLTYANKKITPGAHWMGIAGIAARQSNMSLTATCYTYALSSMAIFDGFIACWTEKYRSQLIRPVTYINRHIDPRWTPFLQTPPFPEHTSGHSTISAAAATVLTQLYGDGFAFHDNSDSLYIGMTRDFPSFHAAAAEASWSRMLGGIHYRTGVEAGAAHGACIGKQLVEKLQVKKLK